jgi:hypothetical protein
VKNLRKTLVLGTALLLSSCTEGQYIEQSFWPFGNPNAPAAHGETAARALGQAPAVTVIASQPGNIWPGPVQPMPTLSQVQQNANLPLGQGYTPSVPSPYPPGVTPPSLGLDNSTGTSLYPSQNGQQVVPPPVPGDER